MANVQMGFGSFLAFYLADLNWSKEDVGLALTAGGLAGVAAQVPGGALADAVRWKRGLAALGILMMAASACILALSPTVPFVFTAEILQGATGGIVGPAIAAISLGLAGRRRMSLRVGRNVRFAAAGSAVVAIAMGLLGSYLRVSSIFFAVILLCIPALIALSRIRADEIDHVRARNATVRDRELDIQRIFDLGKNWQLLLFAVCLVMFQFSNASLLPLVSENLAASRIALSPLFMAALIVIPQTVVALLAPWTGYCSELWGRKPLLLAGFGAEAVRALLFILVTNPAGMMIVQLLDGVTGATVTVLTVMVIADLTAGTGRFNLAQGVVGMMTGTAAAISTTVTGFIAQFGDKFGFASAAAATCVAMVLLSALLPESKPAEYTD